MRSRQPWLPSGGFGLLCLCCAWLGAPLSAGAQNPAVPPTSQGQQPQQQQPQPSGLVDQLKARLQASGMTPDQIRARLAASGYPPDLLDAYMGPTQPGQMTPTPGSDQLAALQALGLGIIAVPGESLAVDTGMIRLRDSLRADSVATGRYVFGVDVFRRTTTQFFPTLAGPVPPDYRLGAGDHLVLIVTGEVEFASTLQVTREGFIVIPQVGQIFVANLTLDQLRQLLFARLGKVYSGIRHGPNATTQFDISVASVRINQVYVIGEVKQPGAYQISALGTVLTSLYAAGGVTTRANLRRIEIRRLNQTVGTFDLYDYLLRGDKHADVRLETGDVVFVPLHGSRAQVTGAVPRPAIYELLPGETLKDVIRAAGGFRPDASLRRVSVYRTLPAPQRGPGPYPHAAIDVPLANATPGDSGFNGVVVPPIALEDGDSVAVDSVPTLAGTMFTGVGGMVVKPGRYPWREGMTLRDLVLLARGPKLGAYLKEAEVARLPDDRSAGQLATTFRVPLDSSYLFERDSTGRYVGPPGLAFPASGTAPEVALRPYDYVLILPQPDFELQRTVSILGEVRSPGRYALSSRDERLSDVLNRAGGLTAQAYPDGINFVRTVNKIGRIDVDLQRALHQTHSRYDIVLEPGDSIYLPAFEPSVKVSGAVNSPGSVLWQQGQSLDYYLDAAGGMSYKADQGKASVRYANGRVRVRHKTLFVKSDPAPGPGSEVFVPIKDTTQRVTWINAVTVAAQFITSLLAVVVLAKQL